MAEPDTAGSAGQDRMPTTAATLNEIAAAIQREHISNGKPFPHHRCSCGRGRCSFLDLLCWFENERRKERALAIRDVFDRLRDLGYAMVRDA